ncbi:polyprenyl synthetase family protein [Lactiplantibacillus fabifermentans]|uniref:Farnesyl diphosphate synthase n=1 Tax=Lactiplantibacillus fabifermentans DSM 21115 TaxID=1413187 RepID=A0A0R2NSK3_9LACO|nr:farnesyl diphosphate synthase [Lactiplantibacillus fabifermentans]KRO27723.1 geranyltranstransferase [Lactiplantibacillus fabifermentans DSM 21115]
MNKDLLTDFEAQWVPQINTYLDENMQTVSNQAQLTAAMRYSVLAGGKRLRPILSLAVLTVFGCEITPANLRASVALELMHTYSLIHDDLPAMDNDNLRRGQPTSHVKFGEDLAILAGDALQPLAFQWLADSDLPADQVAAMTLGLAQAAGPTGMVAGQVADVKGAGHQLPLAALQQLHREKTGALIHYAVLSGLIQAQVPTNQRAAYLEFADAFGLAFQIYDDILDVTSTPAQLGKQTHKDAGEHKNTYPGLLGLDGANAALTAAVTHAQQALAQAAGPDNTLLAAFLTYFTN